MHGGNQSAASLAPVGATLDNGFEIGGSRFYPWSASLAISPTAYYSDYIGPASGVPTAPPVGGLPTTIGSTGVAPSGADVEAASNPFGRTSPLPWVLAGLVFALIVMHYKHYGK